MEFIEILKVLFLGIIEGITEWLPVSSTGHLLLVDELFTLTAREEFKNVFLVVVQLGAILAVVVAFFPKLFPLEFSKTANKNETADANATTNASTNANAHKGNTHTFEKSNSLTSRIVLKKDCLNLWGKVLVACVPAGVVGILLDDWLDSYLHTPFVISLTLIAYGIAFIVIEKQNRNKTFPVQSTHEITYKQAILIGAFQILSLIPGTSRSGATILGALLLGIARPVGAEFTFFLGIPVMAGASLIKILKFILDVGFFTGAELGYLFIGTLTAFAVSLVAIKFLMEFVKKHSFAVFGWYRIGLGIIVLIALYVIPFLG